MGSCTLMALPRCGARAKSTGYPCQQPAMGNGRCYIHGGKASVKHGRYTKQAKQARREERQRIKELRESQKSMEGFVGGA